MTTEPRASLVEVDLLPCPFCGGLGHLRHSTFEIDAGWHVVCHGRKDCPLYCSEPYQVHGDESDAIAVWNTRHRLEALRTPADARSRFALAAAKIECDVRLSELTDAEIDSLVEALRTQGDGELEAARETIRNALMDSQYLAGATAGWNAAQADDPESAFAALQQSRSGHMRGYAEAKRVLSAAPTQASSREEG